jgi:hypothetical protein
LLKKAADGQPAGKTTCPTNNITACPTNNIQALGQPGAVGIQPVGAFSNLLDGTKPICPHLPALDEGF